MHALTYRRVAGVSVLLLLVFTLGAALLPGPAAGQVAGGYEPPEGCVKLEEPKDIPGTTEVELPNGVVVYFDWIEKTGEPEEWIGFEWWTQGGVASGEVKASTEVYSWGPGDEGTFLVPEDADGRVHAISFVIVCGVPEIPEAKGRIILAKVANEPDEQFLVGIFDGWFEGPATSDPVDTDELSSGQSTYWDLEPGEYTVFEELDEGQWYGAWRVTGLSCTESEDIGFEDDDAVAWAELDLDAGETITCTFTNVRSALVVEKQAPSDPTRQFEFIAVPVEADNHTERVAVLDPTFDLSHGEDETRYVGPGTYFVGEELPEGWTLGVSCGTPLVEEDGYTGVVVEVEPGEEATCVFTNTPPTQQTAPPVTVTTTVLTSIPHDVVPAAEEAEVLGIQVEATTVPATLPFTGGDAERYALVGMGLMAFGLVTLAAVRGRRDES